MQHLMELSEIADHLKQTVRVFISSSCQTDT